MFNMTKYKVIQSVAVLFLFLTIIEAQKYTVCTTIKNFDLCEQLNRTQDFRCVLKKNVVNCILMVESGNATLTAVTAEEAVLASPMTTNLVVLGEFIDVNAKGRADYEIAILVHKFVSSGFAALKQSIYCHPGVDGNMQVSPFILQELEKKVLAYHNVDICAKSSPTEDTKTLKEYYIKSLHDFFGPSCRPGFWSVVNNTFDAELKRKYSKLTEICELNAYKENMNEPFLQSFNCLLSGGEIAVTTIKTIENYLSSNPNGLGNYTLLCRDGNNVHVTEKCSWTKQPWPLLLGHKDQVGNLPQELQLWFNQYLYNKTAVSSNDQTLELPEKFIQNLKEIVFPNSFALMNVTEHIPNLATYIKDFRPVPTKESARICKSSMSFCTVTTEEETKCKWTQQAALNYDIQPVIDCTPVTDKDECLTGLQNQMVDLSVVDINWTYNINRKNLTIIGFGEDRDNVRKTVLVVNSTIIKTLNDLEQKRGCFAEYGDMAWLAFADNLKRRVWITSNYYSESLNNYLNYSCMPGVEDKGHEPYPFKIVFDNVCEICESSYNSPIAKSCKPDYTNNYYGNAGALLCLEHPGDFAVLTYSDNLLLPNGTAIMCKNGTILPANVNMDDNCALSVTLNEEIVVRKSDPKNKDIIHLLLELDERFAAQTHTPFRIFDTFDNTKNLMFKDTTVGIESSSSNNRYVKDAMAIFENIPELKFSDNLDKDGAIGATISPFICFISSILAILLVIRL